MTGKCCPARQQLPTSENGSCSRHCTADGFKPLGCRRGGQGNPLLELDLFAETIRNQETEKTMGLKWLRKHSCVLWCARLHRKITETPDNLETWSSWFFWHILTYSDCTQLCLEMLGIKQGRQGDPPHLVVPHEVCWAIAARGRPCASHGRISEHKKCSRHPRCFDIFNMGVSENSVPLNPMVNDHYPY